MELFIGARNQSVFRSRASFLLQLSWWGSCRSRACPQGRLGFDWPEVPCWCRRVGRSRSRLFVWWCVEVPWWSRASGYLLVLLLSTWTFFVLLRFLAWCYENNLVKTARLPVHILQPKQDQPTWSQARRKYSPPCPDTSRASDSPSS